MSVPRGCGAWAPVRRHLCSLLTRQRSIGQGWAPWYETSLSPPASCRNFPPGTEPERLYRYTDDRGLLGIVKDKLRVAGNVSIPCPD